MYETNIYVWKNLSIPSQEMKLRHFYWIKHILIFMLLLGENLTQKFPNGVYCTMLGNLSNCLWDLFSLLLIVQSVNSIKTNPKRNSATRKKKKKDSIRTSENENMTAFKHIFGFSFSTQKYVRFKKENHWFLKVDLICKFKGICI